MAYCPSMARLTLTVTTDMLVKNGGPGVQAVRMWAKQWTFTATSCADGTSGCTVTKRPPVAMLCILANCLGPLSDLLQQQVGDHRSQPFPILAGRDLSLTGNC